MVVSVALSRFGIADILFYPHSRAGFGTPNPSQGPLTYFFTFVGIHPGWVQSASLIELTTIVVISIGDVSWVVSTPRSPVAASLHLVALQLKPS